MPNSSQLVAGHGLPEVRDYRSVRHGCYSLWHHNEHESMNRAPAVSAHKSRGWTDATVRGVADYLSCSDPECSCCHPDDAMLARIQAAAKSSPHSKGIERYWRKRIGNEPLA